MLFSYRCYYGCGQTMWYAAEMLSKHGHDIHRAIIVPKYNEQSYNKINLISINHKYKNVGYFGGLRVLINTKMDE